MNKNKKDGTQWESLLVTMLQGCGLETSRLAEGGQNDPGDIQFEDGYGDTWIIEAKSAQNLNIHQAVAKAEKKAETHGVVLSVVAWRRRFPKKDGERNRQPAGPPIVAMTIPTFLALIQS